VIAEIGGTPGEIIRAIQRKHDPKLANALPPHITIVGSSGLGPIAADTPVTRLRNLLEPVCRSMEPLVLPLLNPVRFIQTDIVVLPLDANGPIRALHERIGTSGLSFARAKHFFTPHITLSFYRSLSQASLRELLSVRITDPIRIDKIRCSLTDEPLPPRTLLDLPLGASGPVGG
jgi:2'-5' RNA ligase